MKICWKKIHLRKKNSYRSSYAKWFIHLSKPLGKFSSIQDGCPLMGTKGQVLPTFLSIKPASQKSPCLFTLLPREAGRIPTVVRSRPPQGQEHVCLINCCQGWALYVGPSNSIQGRGSLPYQKGAWVWRRATESGCAASFALFSGQAAPGSFAIPQAAGCQVPLAMGFPRQGC